METWKMIIIILGNDIGQLRRPFWPFFASRKPWR